MREEERLVKKFGRDAGYRMPDGYMESFQARMRQRLPDYPARPEVPQLTRWQRLRPYVYLAAMFAGIWCMMKVFYDVSERSAAGQVEVPNKVVLAMSAPETAEYVISIDDAESSTQLEEELSEAYDNIEDFKADFDYAFTPEYANIDIVG